MPKRIFLENPFASRRRKSVVKMTIKRADISLMMLKKVSFRTPEMELNMLFSDITFSESIPALFIAT